MTGGLSDADYFEELRAFSQDKLSKVRSLVTEADQLVAGKACVYVTGSFGRLEANSTSDMDLFVVSDCGPGGNDTLTGIDTILVQADLIHSLKKLDLPGLDGDGKYLSRHSISKMVETLGTPDDDAVNTFTARLLLLLESQWCDPDR